MVEVICEDCGERQRIGIFDRIECRRCSSTRLTSVEESEEE